MTERIRDSAKVADKPAAAERGGARAPSMNRAATVEARTALASNALARSDSPLPHRDRIAAAFGAYAVDGIRTTIGGAAGPTAAQLGARAFTVGDRIGFRSEPDLHLAAHEAAHVMQQRAGVQLSAEGRPGDLYERHADAVADAVVAGRSAEPVLAAAPRGSAGTALQLDEDDVDLGFPTIKAFGDRESYVNSDQLLPRIGSGPDAVTIASPHSGLIDLDASGHGIPMQSAMQQAQPLDLGTFGHPHPIAPTLGVGTATMSTDQMQVRIAGLAALLTAIGGRAGKLDIDALGLILGAQAALRWAVLKVVSGPLDYPTFAFEDFSGLIPTEPGELSRQIVRSETVLERVFEALVELATELQQEEITGGAIAQLAPAHAQTYDLPEIRGWFLDQRWQYFTVANRVLQSRIVNDFNVADEAHGDLEKRLLDLKLEYYESIRPATKSTTDAAMTDELRSWAAAVASDVAWLRETAPKLRAAREANTPDTALEARFARKAQLISLSLEALAEFDMMVTAYEGLHATGAVQGFSDIWVIWGRIDQMRAAAQDEDVEYLELLLRLHQQDEAVRAFYESIPDKQAVGIALTMFATVLVGLALGLIAGLIAWGASLAFMATIGVVVIGALGDSWVVLTVLFLARTGLMALVFTLMSRGLEAAVMGTTPTTSFWWDFIWNWGLFAVTEGVSFALKGTLKTLSTVERFAVSSFTNFNVLQLYGLIRGYAEHGRFMTGDELLQMSEQNLIMMVGMTAGMKVFEPMMADVEEAVAVRKFRAKYRGDFADFAAKRAAFESLVRDEMERNPEATEESEKQLREQAEELAKELQDLVGRVLADPEMDIPGVRNEASAMFGRVSRMSLTELLRSNGLASTLEFLPTGRDGQYSFPHGRADAVRAFFATDDSYAFKDVSTAGGGTVFEVTVAGKGRVQLIESPTAERVVVPLSETELATARAEIAEDVAARDALAGGTRGRAAYEIHPDAVQDLNSVSHAMKRIARSLRAEGVTLDGVGVRGTALDGSATKDAAITGKLRVTSTKVPITADVTVEVVPNIDAQNPSFSFQPSVHAQEAGYAQLSITPNGSGGWEVSIKLDARLASEVDVQIQLRHELREAAGILADLAKDPGLGEAYVEAQQRAGVFKTGSDTTLTHHDRAAAAELADLVRELEPALRTYEAGRKGVLEGGGARARARRDAGEIAMRRLDAALDSMGFADPATRAAKTQVLLDTLGVKADSPLGRYVSEYGARSDAAVPRRAALDRISADRASVDATLGPDLAAHVAQRAPADAIDPLAQAVRAGNGTRAADLVREHASGRLTDAELVTGLTSITQPEPLKEWDDPSVTFEEFRASYRARYPLKRGNLSDTELRSRYAAGKRFNPITEALADPTRERPTFEESKTTMAKAEARKRAAFASDETKPKPSTAFDAELAEMQTGGLTANDVGALGKWSRLYGKLSEIAARVSRTIPTPKQLLAGLGRGYKRAPYDAFRDRMTDSMLDVILDRGSDGKPTRAPADQAKLLRELLGEDLELFPDSAAKGSFYNKYSVARFSDKSGDIYVVKPETSLKFDNPDSVKLEKVRFGDGVIHVKNQAAEGGPADGEYAFDGKAGRSLDPKQLRDVNALMTDKGIRMGGTQKQGVVYWCENNANATELVKALNTIGANAKMHVAYVDSDGGVVWMR